MRRVLWSLMSISVLMSFVLLYTPGVREWLAWSPFGYIWWYGSILVVLVVLEGLYIVLPRRLGGSA